jgi:hypothetical protein
MTKWRLCFKVKVYKRKWWHWQYFHVGPSDEWLPGYCSQKNSSGHDTFLLKRLLWEPKLTSVFSLNFGAVQQDTLQWNFLVVCPIILFMLLQFNPNVLLCFPGLFHTIILHWNPPPSYVYQWKTSLFGPAWTLSLQSLCQSLPLFMSQCTWFVHLLWSVTYCTEVTFGRNCQTCMWSKILRVPHV